MFCSKCGKEIASDSQFCSVCGAATEAKSTTQIVQPQTYQQPTEQAVPTGSLNLLREMQGFSEVVTKWRDTGIKINIIYSVLAIITTIAIGRAVGNAFGKYLGIPSGGGVVGGVALRGAAAGDYEDQEYYPYD